MDILEQIQEQIEIRKAIISHDDKLEYFKREIVKILEKQAESENKPITKSIDFLTFLYVEKSALGVGHVSTYKDGSMWKKIQSNPPKWKCIRQGKNFSSETSGAKQSITKLINKVKSCNSTDELLDIVLFNIDRFRDEKGQILPIVEKLKTEVESRKTDFAISKELSRKYSKQEAVNTIKEWATQENFDKAKGKTRDEIFFSFGQKLKPIGKIPEKYLSLLNPKSGDTRVFCGKGYFIDHMVNHHPSVPLSNYEIIPDVLENPDNVKIDDKKSVPTVIFQKKTDKYGTVVVNCKADGDRVIFYKTGFTGNKESYKNKPSVVDRNPTINPSSVGGNGNVSALPNGNSNIPQSAASVKHEFNSADDVKSFYKGTDKWLKAPNGKDTKLTEKQWCQVRTKNFKNWFGDWENDPQNASRVVGENGEPLVVYHGSNNNFDEFSKKIKTGYFFSSNKSTALDYTANNNVKECFLLSSKNPIVLDAEGNYFTDILSSKDVKNYVKNELQENFNSLTVSNFIILCQNKKKIKDGIIFKNICDNNHNKNDIGTDYIVFKSNQIKSATDNNGDFNPKENSINKSAIIYNNRLYINKSMLAELQGVL